jgi:beta-lactamase regulating signal transducer with metallopeptidase domain/uncharacterized membrane protein YkoI/biotin carboxyl carrier protein
MERISQLILTFLLNAGWQIALLTAVAALCAWLLRDTAARYRHWLWVTALTLAYGLPMLAGLNLSGRAWFSGQPQPAITVQRAIVETPPIPLDATGFQPKTASLIPVSRILALAIVALYVVFLCYRSSKLFRAWRQTRALARGALAVELPEHVRQISEQCQNVLGVKRVQVLGSTVVPVPITIGSRKPLVILPEPLLHEANRDLLTAAIGHEMVHVLRRDYGLNLIYELIYLPLSFHPAAAFVRRRIRETRELRCDEMVADRLLEADVYARSLVQLAGSAMALSRPTTITVGITDADILEERVMTMLRRPKTNVRGKRWLPIVASLFLILPCVAAAAFAPRISIDPLSPGMLQSQDGTQVNSRKAERARAAVGMPVFVTVRETGTLIAWLKKPGETVERGDIVAKVDTTKGVVEVAASASGVIEKLIVPIGVNATPGTVLAVIREQEPSTSSALSAAQQEEDQVKALRLARRKYEEEKMRVEREVEERSMTPEQREQLEAHRRAEREAMAKRQAELARMAKVSMQQAIQTALNHQPGTVMECRLKGEQGTVWYLVTILTGEDTEHATSMVIINGVDGQVIKTIKEER